jgi:hypothetical protein
MERADFSLTPMKYQRGRPERLPTWLVDVTNKGAYVKKERDGHSDTARM